MKLFFTIFFAIMAAAAACVWLYQWNQGEIALRKAQAESAEYDRKQLEEYPDRLAHDLESARRDFEILSDIGGVVTIGSRDARDLDLVYTELSIVKDDLAKKPHGVVFPEEDQLLSAVDACEKLVAANPLWASFWK